MVTFLPVLRALPALFLTLLVAASPALAQAGATLSGKVTRAETGDAMAGTIVAIEELKREARTDADGSYRFDNVMPGAYHVAVRAEGYSSRRTEVQVTAAGATLDLAVDLDLHFSEVLSVGPAPRPQFESYQPTSVLAGQDLAKQLESTLGATLMTQPGVAMRSLGPGPSRPVIRGLDGDRVLVLQDGQRTGDLSSQSGDHGVTSNPAAAERIEVVRGPATLLYGASAIGGLVNVVTDDIPTQAVTRPTGNFTSDLASNAGEVSGAGDVHFGRGPFAFHAGGGGRRAGDYETPDEDVLNSQSRAGFFSLGGSWTHDKHYAGASYGYDDNKYGIPVLEDGNVSLTPRRHSVTVRGGGQGLDGALTSYRATLGVRRYQHDELEGEEIGTTFKNNTVEGELLVSHKPLGKLSGSVGTWFLDRKFDAIGEEALSPAVDQRTYAAFFYEELTWPHFTFQFGGRVDDTDFSPKATYDDRRFTEYSGSIGALIRPQAANDNIVFAFSLARAARNPALEELYFFGNHPGNFAFEVGNPNLTAERGLGFDASIRTRLGRVRGEFNVFRNDIADFIYREPLDEDEAAAAGVEDPEFPVVQFQQADSTLFGMEAHADIEVTEHWIGELSYDWVQGEQKDTGYALPRIPPYRVMGGLRFQRNAFQAGGNVTGVATQDRVYENETPTDGYTLVRLYASYSFQSRGVLSTITARLDNAGNTLYRNHLNYLKDLVPEIGRNFKLVYNLSF